MGRLTEDKHTTLKIRHKEIIVRTFFFLVAALVITYIIPREGRFRYIFNEGKPWKYGLLTAPYDFPIYKPDVLYSAQKDSVLKGYTPFLVLDSAAGANKVRRFEENFLSSNAEKAIPTQYRSYVVRALTKGYQRGVISITLRDQMQSERIEKAVVLTNGIGKTVPIASLISEKELYEQTIDNLPDTFSRSILQSLNISEYIQQNLRIDSARSISAREEMLESVPYATGMVQAGEKIIDRGEIITPQTYNILRSLETETKLRKGGEGRDWWMLGGEFIMITTLIFCMFFYLLFFRNETFRKKRLVLFLLMLILGMTLIAALFVQRSLDSIYLIPFAIVPLVVRTFFDSRTALFAHIITILLCSIMAPFPYEFTLLQLTVGMTAIFSLKDLTQRSQIVKSAFVIFLTYAFIYFGFSLLQEGDLSKVKSSMYLLFFLNGVFLLFTYLLIFIFEKLFGFVSNVTLVELSNINSPFLRRFSEECPGSFQHSMQVSNLAAAAAAAINANVQLARTGALFHDIGKMENPAFFTENQGGENPHSKLSCEESAQIIIKHVDDGVRLAQSVKLPEQVIEFIRTHHGKGKAKYFYTLYCNDHPGEEIEEEKFTYHGDLPYTKETSIVMMADAVEATSRSLKEYTEESISAVVKRTIDGQVADGLLKNSRLSFRDVEHIKNVFIDKLKIIYHTRIAYPELNTNK